MFMFMFVCVCVGVGVCVSARTYRVLEAKQHQLYLVDGGGVEVKVQLELGDGGCHDAALWRVDEVSQDADDLLDVVHGKLELFTALHTHTYARTHACTHARTHAHTYTHKHTHNMQKPYHIQNTHTQTHRNQYTHTHTHTHTNHVT